MKKQRVIALSCLSLYMSTCAVIHVLTIEMDGVDVDNNRSLPCFLRYANASASVVAVEHFLLSVRMLFFLLSLFPFHPFFSVSPSPIVHAQVHDMKSCIPVFLFCLCVCLWSSCGYRGYTLYPLPMRSEWIATSLFIPSPSRLE